MFRQRPGRVKAFPYRGYQRYFLTICTAHSRRVFLRREDIEWMLVALREILAAEKLALLAYCFMPDHVHLLLEGLTPDSALEPAVARWKQVCGFEYSKRHGLRLWQVGYYDRVLRDDEAGKDVALYILANPVRKGLAKTVVEYPLSGSDVWTLEELAGSLDSGQP